MCSELEDHLKKKTCEYSNIDCKHKNYGCTWKGLRNELPTHLKSNCTFEKLSPLFQAFEKRFDVFEGKSRCRG